jgi:ketosteroid isomerase-like protein
LEATGENRSQVILSHPELECVMPDRSPSTGSGALTLARALFAIVALSIFAANYAGLQTTASAADDEKHIQELEEQFQKAVVQGDVATFERLLADDFTHTSQDGSFRTRAEWLKGRVQGKSNYVSYVIDDQKIRIYGDTAVVTGLAKPSWREKDGSSASGQFRFLRVWVKRDERWQAVAFQSTRTSENKE